MISKLGNSRAQIWTVLKWTGKKKSNKVVWTTISPITQCSLKQMNTDPANTLSILFNSRLRWALLKHKR